MNKDCMNDCINGYKFDTRFSVQRKFTEYNIKMNVKKMLCTVCSLQVGGKGETGVSREHRTWFVIKYNLTSKGRVSFTHMQDKSCGIMSRMYYCIGYKLLHLTQSHTVAYLPPGCY